MRLEIRSSDRIGITQEILTVFANRAWNLKAIEVELYLIFVHIEEKKMSLFDVQQSLAEIEGISSCEEIKFLPSERRENHLQALLARIPDPIVDIDEKGNILAINQSAIDLINQTEINFEGRHIDSFIEPSLARVLQNKPTSVSLTFGGVSTLADINPVIIGDKINGAVIVFRTMKTLGRQISLMQAEKEHGIDNIIGQSQKIKVVKEQTLRFAELELPVFITGETGTGKELLARAIHDASLRSKSPFLAINCAALPENLLESELFGYSQGAFTGAQRGGKPGLFELAEGGTIFLDEIAEMSTYLQAKLLRFLEDFRFRRLGGTKEITANVRIISASHQDFEQRLAQKLFREDLFYRLNVLNLKLPPLRERTEDIALLAAYFVKNSALQVNQRQPILDEQALNILKRYRWPGNIRQLQNILFRVVALNESGLIGEEELSSALNELGAIEQKNQLPIDNPKEVSDWASAQRTFEHSLLSQLLPLYPTTRKLATRLKVSHNKIAMKLRELGLNRS